MHANILRALVGEDRHGDFLELGGQLQLTHIDVAALGRQDIAVGAGTEKPQVAFPGGAMWARKPTPITYATTGNVQAVKHNAAIQVGRASGGTVGHVVQDQNAAVYRPSGLQAVKGAHAAVRRRSQETPCQHPVRRAQAVDIAILGAAQHPSLMEGRW